MADQFVAEIRIFAGNFPPTGWAECNGQLMPISQNTALFSLIGTFYGGDGRSTFGLPNLQGMAAMHQGQGPGLSQRFIGETSGENNVTLLPTEMPTHNHIIKAKASGGQADPGTKLFGVAGTQLPPPNFYTDTQGSAQIMNQGALTIAGSSFPHNNLMPYLVLNYIIALQGIFPPRS